jgi:ribonuclease E
VNGAVDDEAGGRDRARTASAPSAGGRAVRRPPTDVGADDEAPLDSTLETQREDALPDGSQLPSTGARKRRGRRGSGATKRIASIPSEEAAEPATDPETPRRPRTRTNEEQVEAGGPTRGLRSSRSRTGRVGGGRRRREDTVVVPRITDKIMVITEHGDRDQIAVLEENVLVQHYVTRTGARSMVGNVYLGRVQNVLPGMEAAFIDIGRGRNGVLYAGEVNYAPEDLEGPQPRIEQILKNGQPVMVQVTKDPMGGKGARLTAQISMPGRFLVFVPNANISGISRRLSDDERRRLKTIMKNVRPEGHGVIVRTAAEGASEDALTADLLRLVREWEDIQKQSRKAKAPAVLYEEPELTVRVVRDLFTDEEFKELATDSPRVHEKVMSYVHDVAPDLESKVHLHQGRLPVFEEYRVVEQIHKALDKKVWLPSGGYLFIERTEAMTIIDVNTGKSVGKTNLEATVTNTNLEAAREVARQLRLRDIGGIIVIDFIDMLLEKNKKQVEDAMKEALAVDKTRSQVFEIGPLGLMQVTRKRVSGGLVESFSETCPTCEGRGILVNYEA